MNLTRSERPIIKLRICHASCRAEVRLNDVPVFQDPRGRSSTAEIPVNEWLRPGANVFSLSARPLPIHLESGEEDFEKESLSYEATVEVEVVVKSHQGMERLGSLTYRHREAQPKPDFMGMPTGTESSSPALPEDASNKIGGCSPVEVTKDEATKSVFARRAFYLPEDWPNWLWEGGQVIERGSGMAFVLTRLHQQIWTLLNEGHWVELDRLLEVRTREYGQAYFLDGSQARESFGWASLFDDGSRLLPFPTKPCRVEVFGQGKLVRLFADDGVAPIRLLSPSGLWHVIHPTHANLHGGWVVVR